jgi:hypothetical protein
MAGILFITGRICRFASVSALAVSSPAWTLRDPPASIPGGEEGELRQSTLPKSRSAAARTGNS